MMRCKYCGEDITDELMKNGLHRCSVERILHSSNQGETTSNSKTSQTKPTSKLNSDERLGCGIAAFILFFIVIVGVVLWLISGNGAERENYIGDIITIDNITTTVTKVENSQKFTGLTVDRYTSKNFIIVYFTVYNHSNSSITAGRYLSTLYMGDQRYDVAYAVGNSDIIPEETRNVIFCFETMHTTQERDFMIRLIIGWETFEINLYKKPIKADLYINKEYDIANKKFLFNNLAYEQKLKSMIVGQFVI